MTELSQSPFIFISVFFLGLGLNLTPCIYPMLSITISLFRGGEHETRGRAFMKALAYVLGMVTMYSVLGLVAAVTGGFFGEWLQNFWVQLATGILVTGLAFSMLGLYQFRLPSWMMPSGHGAAQGALLSFFVSGLLVGIVAAPCMGPAILALLAFVSVQQDKLFGFSLFFVMALGLGLPYLVLGTFSGLLLKLPKSGSWLVWFERLMGVVLLTFGISYVAIAFKWPFVKWIVPLALVAGGLYLGWIERSARLAKKFFAFQGILGTLAVVIGLFFFFMPKNGIVWEKYHAGILEEAGTSGRPVILDFYADWCIPCHELDQFTYSDPKVVAILKHFRKIKVDVTSVDSDEVREAIRRFNVLGVPTIIFLNEKGLEVPALRMDGFVTPEEFVSYVHSSRLGDTSGNGERGTGNE
ncbi:MAG: cytochrome c biogenesis protein CcdA [Candidatus Omnitrophica bacterium]|nr:cytochrome c biogenesis protein CcdA [Candidatus Omnitrophota bacterium]